MSFTRKKAFPKKLRAYLIRKGKKRPLVEIEVQKVEQLLAKNNEATLEEILHMSEKSYMRKVEDRMPTTAQEITFLLSFFIFVVASFLVIPSAFSNDISLTKEVLIWTVILGSFFVMSSVIYSITILFLKKDAPLWLYCIITIFNFVSCCIWGYMFLIKGYVQSDVIFQTSIGQNIVLILLASFFISLFAYYTRIWFLNVILILLILKPVVDMLQFVSEFEVFFTSKLFLSIIVFIFIAIFFLLFKQQKEY